MKRLTFKTWAAQDVNDERFLNVELRSKDGKRNMIEYFNTGTPITLAQMLRLQAAFVESAEIGLNDNEWHIVLSE